MKPTTIFFNTAANTNAANAFIGSIEVAYALFNKEDADKEKNVTTEATIVGVSSAASAAYGFFTSTRDSMDITQEKLAAIGGAAYGIAIPVALATVCFVKSGAPDAALVFTIANAALSFVNKNIAAISARHEKTGLDETTRLINSETPAPTLT